MSINPGYVLADPDLTAHDLAGIAKMLGSLSGAMLVIGIVGALIGWGASWIFDWLPAGIAVPAGIVGIFLVLAIL